jgi:predicted nucleotidyltransferase
VSAAPPGVVDAAARVGALADRLAEAYLEHTKPRAMLLVGSAATGEVDGYSDVDLLLYYDAVPAETGLHTARSAIGAERFVGTDWPGEGYSERYDVEGIHCQLGHVLIDAWEREIAKVVDELDLDARLVKQLIGLADGRPLHGEQLIAGWRRRAEYTPRLQRAMVEKHWRFFPWWYYEEKLLRRDATIWRYEVLAQSAYNLVGVLAALNRIYFSTFEFKRVRSYLGAFDVAPSDLADRLEALFTADARTATLELERLVDETRALVDERFPDIDLTIEWAGNPTPPGSRETPWA